jgi:S1-C subfamily serine protease
LTNNHVIEGCKLSKINYFNREYETNLISTDKTLDLALLKVDLKPKSYISFSRDELKKRQQITVAGYPLGKGLSDDLKINDGRISSLKGYENNSSEITVDVAINPGNSGGPIVNQKGQLVAIAVAGMSKDVTEGINFGIKASAAANFLKSNKINLNVGYTSFSMDDDKIVKLLEESTVYTFCE